MQKKNEECDKGSNSKKANEEVQKVQSIGQNKSKLLGSKAKRSKSEIQGNKQPKPAYKIIYMVQEPTGLL